MGYKHYWELFPHKYLAWEELGLEVTVLGKWDISKYQNK